MPPNRYLSFSVLTFMPWRKANQPKARMKAIPTAPIHCAEVMLFCPSLHVSQSDIFPVHDFSKFVKAGHTKPVQPRMSAKCQIADIFRLLNNGIGD